VFPTREARALRLACSKMRDGVAGAAWRDVQTRIKDIPAASRACFPIARSAKVEAKRDLV
jgi:hypothetical protein